ncbi:hypothetical protein GW17_00059964, partial [Ensete ventricosum]
MVLGYFMADLGIVLAIVWLGFGVVIVEGSEDAVGPRWEFARRFTEGIEKLTGNMLENCQKKTIRLAARMPEAAGLVG